MIVLIVMLIMLVFYTVKYERFIPKCKKKYQL